MGERYADASWRHLRTAEILLRAGESDDAGYHFGICCENVIKHALQTSGLEQRWIMAGLAVGQSSKEALKHTPMRGHLPQLIDLVRKARVEIALYATGRIGAALMAIVFDTSFSSMCSGWHMDIRYADPQYCPVSAEDCASWHDDATDLLLVLAI